VLYSGHLGYNIYASFAASSLHGDAMSSLKSSSIYSKEAVVVDMVVGSLSFGAIYRVWVW
jgi:hypothetical protein